jgi:hypothetical protein
LIRAPSETERRYASFCEAGCEVAAPKPKMTRVDKAMAIGHSPRPLGRTVGRDDFKVVNDGFFDEAD